MQVLNLSLLVLLTAQQCVSLNIQASFSKIVDAVHDELVREISDTFNPLAQIATATAFFQCSLLKDALMLNYKNSTDEDRQAKLDNLTLNFITSDVKISFPLRAILTELPVVLGDDLSSVQLKIFIHGFTDNPDSTNFQIINEAYRSLGVKNLALDASPFIKHGYLSSSTNVHYIGNRLGEALAVLVDAGMLPENIHLVGHSLGAHISGFTGKRLTELTGKKVGRISGLDPAGPCYAQVNETLRLKTSDAVFVDVIHSNAGVLGIDERVGHVEFYPNGGSQQPDCLSESCSHGAVVKFYAESIRNKTSFPAVSCTSYDQFTKGKCNTEVINYMGEGALSSVEGQFYLQTNGESPYSKGCDGITYVNTKGIVRTIQTPIFDLIGFGV